MTASTSDDVAREQGPGEPGKHLSSPVATTREELTETLHIFEAELQEAQTRLEASEALTRSILETAPVGIGVMNAQRVFLAANPAIGSITGYAPDELIGHSSRLLYPSEEEFERIGVEKDNQLWEQGRCSIEARLRHKNGQPIDVIWSIAPLSPDSPEGLLTVSFRTSANAARRKPS